MHGHTGGDDLDSLLAQFGDRFTKLIVLIWVVGVEEGHLHDRDIDRISFRIKENAEARPDAVIKTALRGLRADARFVEEGDDGASEGGGAAVRELRVVVVCGEAVEVVDQVGLLGDVDLDDVRLALPVRREDDDALGLDKLGDLFADFDELRVDGVGGLVHDVWLGNG